MGPPITDTGEGGGGYGDIRNFLPIGSPGNPSIWVGDVGHDPPHGKDPARGLPLGGDMSHGKTLPAPIRLDLESPSVSVGHTGSGDRGYGGVYLEAT